MRFIAKGKRFDLDNIKSFKNIYRDMESGYTMLKDMDDLV
jgi:hypothetical protein